MPQRSPINTGLLFAATLAVDLVAWVWAAATRFGAASGTLFLALMFSQIGLLCIGAVFSHGSFVWRVAAPFAAGCVAGVLTNLAIKFPDDIIPHVGFYWINAAAALVVLWLLMPTRIFRRTRPDDDKAAWRFSIWNLLIVTTVVAIMLRLLGKNTRIHDAAEVIGVIVVGNIFLLVIVAGISTTAWHGLVRLAASLGAAWAIGAVCQVADNELSRNFDLTAYHVVQALVIIVWLELVPIMPARSLNRADDAPPTSRLPQASLE
jgi:hypothetical protein